MTTLEKLQNSVRRLGNTSEADAEKAGFDCGINGANMTNCHVRFFGLPEMTRAWERGKKRAENDKANS